MIDLGDFSMETSAPCKMTHRGGMDIWGEVRVQGVDYGVHYYGVLMKGGTRRDLSHYNSLWAIPPFENGLGRSHDFSFA